VNSATILGPENKKAADEEPPRFLVSFEA